jgi:hypothetical protein
MDQQGLDQKGRRGPVFPVHQGGPRQTTVVFGPAGMVRYASDECIRYGRGKAGPIRFAFFWVQMAQDRRGMELQVGIGTASWIQDQVWLGRHGQVVLECWTRARAGLVWQARF